jgi:hypothetical protein
LGSTTTFANGYPPIASSSACTCRTVSACEAPVT